MCCLACLRFLLSSISSNRDVQEDGFYYDALHTYEGAVRLRVRSLVGLVPLFAVGVPVSNL
jgi:hypothetical protein